MSLYEYNEYLTERKTGKNTNDIKTIMGGSGGAGRTSWASVSCMTSEIRVEFTGWQGFWVEVGMTSLTGGEKRQRKCMSGEIVWVGLPLEQKGEKRVMWVRRWNGLRTLDAFWGIWVGIKNFFYLVSKMGTKPVYAWSLDLEDWVFTDLRSLWNRIGIRNLE